LKFFARIIDLVTENIGRAVSLIALPIMIIIAIEVVARYFFNHPTRWAWSVATHLFGVLSLFGGAYALLHGRHIRVEILYERFGSRLKLLSHILTAVCFLLFIGVLVWQGIEMAEMSIKSREVIRGIIHFPVYPLKTLLPIATFLLLLQGIAIFLRRNKK
jgi:TRAP-type mannitol/chloroaromatic compound transport system permease small subunit